MPNDIPIFPSTPTTASAPRPSTSRFSVGRSSRGVRQTSGVSILGRERSKATTGPMSATGLPEDRTLGLGGVWIMEAGTSAAHIMIPGR